MSTEVTIFGPGIANSIIGAEPGLLWYFGSDFGRYASLTAERAVDGVAPVGEAVNAAAKSVRNDLINIDASLYTGRCRLAWISSDLAEPNPTMSDFVLNVSRIIAFFEAARAGGRHLIVVDDSDCGRMLEHVIARAGMKVRTVGLRRQVVRKIVGGLLAHVGFLRDWWRERAVALRSSKDGRRLPKDGLLLVTWADGKSEAARREDQDRFFGLLPVWLRETGKPFAWLLNPARWMNPISTIAARVAAMPEAALLVPALTGYRAFIRSYAALAALPLAVRRRWRYRGIDLTPLVRYAMWREFFTTRLVSAARYAELARTLKKRGLLPKAVLYTFENQPWEKAMIFGFRSAHAETRMIGVQHAPLAENYLSAHISKEQWDAGVAPDVLLTIGAEFRDRLIHLGAPDDRVRVGGALRFTELMKEAGRPCAAPTAESRLVVASCPMDQRDCYDLVYKAALAAQGLVGVRTAINFHPMTEDAFRHEVRRWLAARTDCSHVDFVEGGVSPLLSKASILLYNSSSAAFEAVARHVPIIFVGSSFGLDVDSAGRSEGRTCRSVDSLRSEILNLLNDPVARKGATDNARASLERCFSMPKSDFWLSVVKGCA